MPDSTVPSAPQRSPTPQGSGSDTSSLRSHIDRLEQRTDLRLTNLENSIQELAPIGNTLQDVCAQIERLPNELAAELNALRDGNNAHIDNIHESIAAIHEDIYQLRNIVSTHLTYLYFLNNSNPHTHLPDLPIIEDEFRHIFEAGQTDFSPFKIPKSDYYPMDSIPTSAIRKFFPPLPSPLTTHTQAPRAPPLTPPNAVASYLREATSITILSTKSRINTYRSPLLTRTPSQSRTKAPDCNTFGHSNITITPLILPIAYRQKLHLILTYNISPPHLYTRPQSTNITLPPFLHNLNHTVRQSLAYARAPSTPHHSANYSHTKRPHNPPLIPSYSPPQPLPHTLIERGSTPTPDPHHSVHVQIVIITLNSLKHYFRYPFLETTTVADLLNRAFPAPTSLPAHFRVRHNNTAIPLLFPINRLRDTISELHIVLPILGGNPRAQLPQSLSTPLPPPHPRPDIRKITTRPGFTIRIATLNCNGCLKNNPDNRHQLLWEFIRTNKIDVLYLIDHRTAPKSMERIKQHGSNYLQLDIKLITTDITRLHRPHPRANPLYNYHATVGGCAIMTFGSLAHITFPTNFLDPSGAGSFVGAKLQTHSALPPIFLNAIYLFPPSPGPTTLNTRIASYLLEQRIPLTPTQWQRDTIAQMLEVQYDSHPDCSQIVGGDFNHGNWSDVTHPTTRLFLHDLNLLNSAFQAFTHANGEIPQPITYLPKQTWIDHILHTGRTEITDFRDYQHSLVTTYTDHAPYSNDIYIHVPTQHYNIPQNSFIRAQALSRATHIKKHNTIAYNRFQATCTKYISKFIPPQTTQWSVLDHDNHYNFICNSLVDIARKSVKYSLRPSMASYARWSPHLSFLYKLIRHINHSRIRLTSSPTLATSELVHHNLVRFLATQYSKTITVNETLHYRYRDILTAIFPHYPTLPVSPTYRSITIFLQTTLAQCRTLCHAKHQSEMRSKINTRVAAHEQARKEGKLKQVITWILDKDTSPRFTTVVTNTHEIKSHPRDAHRATLQHFTDHFSCHPWISLSSINSPTTEGHHLRDSLLNGTWRTNYPTIIHSLEPRHRQHAAAYLDNFKYKCSPAQRASLHSLTSNPISLDSFLFSLSHRNGSKSPGPSGLTISILQATPLPILQQLHTSLSVMWEHRHVPQSWQNREMALIPKKPTSVTLAELRPIMLLEVLRKLWLSLILKPVATFLSQQHLLCPYQVGGIANSGTEDAILQIINSIEDSSERAENLEILAFDKSKAFDSPARIGGISLAWQRMGLPTDIATYIADCDNNNAIFPRTPYYLTSPAKHPHLSFHAAMGTPQGCSSASLSYLVVEDIILSTFEANLHLIDPYLSRDPNGILFRQTPTQFIDDTYVMCRSIQGAQNAIDLLQTAEPLLNIRINPSKTRHFSIHWAPPLSNSKPYYTLQEPHPTLSAYDSAGTSLTITPIPLSQPTRVLGAHLSPDMSNTHLIDIRRQILRITNTMTTKRASIGTLWSVIKLSVYPKLAYPLKFTNLSMKDIHKIAGPLRHLIRLKSNASHLPNAILFAGNATPYSLPYLDLMTHVCKEKESIMLRMLAGPTISRQIIHSLLTRATRIISDNTSFSTTPQPCQLLPHHLDTASPSHYCWGLSLVQYLQAASSNLHTTTPPPQTYPDLPVTQTPLHTLFIQTLDYPLTLSDIKDFESSYHLYFLEELFPYTPLPPNTYLPQLLQLFPNHLHPFLTRIIRENHMNPTITPGTIILREHLILQLPQDHTPHYIEGILPPLRPQDHPQALTRPWVYLRHRGSNRQQCISLNHTPTHIPILKDIPTHPFSAPRLIRSALGYTKKQTLCQYIHFTQHILPRNPASATHQYAQPTFSCNLHPTIREAWHQLSTHPAATINVYTDGSLKPSTPLYTHQPSYPPSTIATAIVFSTDTPVTTSWHDRKVFAIKINFPSPTTANNYTAEILGVAVAASLPHHAHITNIHTDAKGILTSIHKTLNHPLTNHPSIAPHLPRHYTETGLLYKQIINHTNYINLHHIKAHQEDSLNSDHTEHGSGNRLADLVAQADYAAAQRMCPHLQIFEANLDDIITTPSTPPQLTIGRSITSHQFYLHHPNTTAKAFLANRINDWILNVRPITTQLSPLPWSNLTWNVAGSAVTKYAKTSALKSFLLKVLYDALPNDYTKYKYATKPSQDNPQTPQDPNLPACPLCASTNDSLSHLFCQCTHPSILPLRQHMLRELSHLLPSTNISNPLYLATQQLLSYVLSSIHSPLPDHRTLLGLFHIPSLHAPLPPYRSTATIMHTILSITAPFLRTTWKTYCDITHSPTSPQRPHASPSHHPSRLIVISGNNASISLQTVQDHPPPLYHRNTRRTHSTRIHRPHISQPTQRTLHDFFTPSHPTPPSPSAPTTLSTTIATPVLSPSLSLHTPASLTPAHNHNPVSDCSLHPPSDTHNAPFTPLTPTASLSTAHAPQAELRFEFPKRYAIPSPIAPSVLCPTNTSSDLLPHQLPSQGFEHLEVYDTPPPTCELQVPFHYPHQTPHYFKSIKSSNLTSILSALHLHTHDVPPTGDCFYLAIQLYFTHHSQSCLLTVPALRSAIHQLLVSTTVGSQILRDYHQTTQHALDILPSLCPLKFPNRDIFAQDYVIAAMATLLNAHLEIYTYDTDSTPVAFTFSPYPSPTPLTPFLPNSTPHHISLLATNAHFQLLLPYRIDIPSITANLLPLPKLPSSNTNTTGAPTIIPAPSRHNHHPNCPFQPQPPPNALPAFCPPSCHPHCPNQYSAFKPIPHQRTSRSTTSSQLLSLIGVDTHSPLFELHAPITPSITPRTFPITPRHHSTAPQSHPLIRLMYSDQDPNVSLTPFLIPHPTPHLKLFAIACKPITPYSSLRIRPPPEPPPSAAPQIPVGRPIPITRPHRITAYFPRIPKPS